MTRRLSPGNQDTPAAALLTLPTLSTGALKDRWRELYGAEPGEGLGRRLLIRGLTYRLQEQAFGGLRPNTSRWLDRVADSLSAGHPSPAPARRIAPGTHLLRQWQGETYEALMVEGGVLFRGRHYRSLSEVARRITGSRWSGPLFFGLTAKDRKNAS